MVSREGFHDLREVLMSSDRIGLDQVLVQNEVDEAELAAVPFAALQRPFNVADTTRSFPAGKHDTTHPH